MTLTELRYIVALSETQHFKKAAQQCNVSQPSLSIAVKKLEQELGVALFERTRQSVIATPIGQQIVAQAQTVLRESQGISKLAELGKDPLGAILSVGAIYTVGPYLFPRLINALHERAPDMPLYVEENYTANLRTRLSSGELDAIFIALPFTEPDVVSRPLYEEPFVVVMPHNHPLASKESIDPGELADHLVLLMGPGHCFRDQVLAACSGLEEAIARNQKNGHTMMEGSSLETLKHMVASGLGITVLPESASTLQSQYQNKQLAIRPFSSSAPTRSVALAWRASYPRHEAIDLLIDGAGV